MKLIPREWKPAALELAPGLGALGALGAGVMLLASSATPVDSERFRWLAMLLPRLVIHTSDFLSSVIGLLLVLLAFGLSRRVNAAWAATLGLLFVAAVLAIFKGLAWEETTVLALVGLLLAPLGGAFYRTARLTRIEFSPGWLLSAGRRDAGGGGDGVLVVPVAARLRRPVVARAGRHRRQPRAAGRDRRGAAHHGGWRLASVLNHLHPRCDRRGRLRLPPRAQDPGGGGGGRA